jgi:WD40 repeat protein
MKDQKGVGSAVEHGAALPGGATARLGTPRAVITGRIKAIQPSPDGRWLAVVSESRARGQAEIVLLDAKTLALVRTFAPFHGGLPVLQFSSDSGILHTRQSSWSVDTGEAAARPADGELVGGSPNGKFGLFRRPQDQKLAVWDTQARKEIGTLESRFSPHGMIAAVSDDGRYVARIENFKIRIDDVVNKTAIEPSDRVNAMRVLALPDSHHFLSHGAGGPGATLFDATNGKTLRQFEAPRSLAYVAVSNDGRQIAAGIPHQFVRVWEVATGEIVQDLPISGYEIYSLAYSADNKTLFSSAERGRADFRLFAWDTKEWQEQPRENDPRGPYRRLVYSPDGRWLAADSVLGKIDLWDVAEKRLAHTLVADASSDLRFSPDGWLIGAAGPNQGYGIWEVESGEQLFRDPNSVAAHSVASFSPQLDWLAVSGGGRMSRIKTTTGQLEAVTTRQNELIQGQIFSLTRSPDGKLLLCTNAEYPPADVAPITQVEIATGNVSHPFKGHQPLPRAGDPEARGRHLYRASWSPDGATFAATDERRTINLWDVRSGDYWGALQHGDLWPVFSPGGNYIAGCGQQTLTLYEVHSGAVVFSRNLGPPPTARNRAVTSRNATDGLPDNGLTALAISPDGRHLAGAFRDDDTILLWSLVPLARQEIDQLKAADTEDYEAWWVALNDANPQAAYAATWRFAMAGDKAIALLNKRVGKSAAAVDDPARIEKLVNELDQALKTNIDAEMRQAIAILKAKSGSARSYLTTDQLARLRAIVAMERSGSAAAMEGLKILAQGADHQRATWFARSALERLQTRGVQ